MILQSLVYCQLALTLWGLSVPVSHGIQWRFQIYVDQESSVVFYDYQVCQFYFPLL